MGYNTKFTGELKFQGELTVPALVKLQSMLGEDCRDHKEWNAGDACYIDLVLLKDYSGLQWDTGTEKTYGLVESVNVIIREMQKEFPQFSLCGVLTAQGEDIDDRWQLYIGQDGFAHKRAVAIVGTKITCQHCEKQFYIEQA